MALSSENAVISVDEYLRGELLSDVKHEYDNGFVVAMVGASRAHNRIALTLAGEIQRHLKGRPCQTYISDMKVRIRSQWGDQFYYPDVMVSCDPDPVSEYYEEKPVLIVEVLSPLTETRDKLEKLAAYSRLPSLAEYVTVAQDRVEVTQYRFARETTTLTRYQDGDIVEFTCIGFSMAVKDIYAPVAGLVPRD